MLQAGAYAWQRGEIGVFCARARAEMSMCCSASTSWDEPVLLRFHLVEGYRAQAATIFRWLIAIRGVRSRSQPPYADLGMVVARASRGKGPGRAMLIHLKERCYAAAWEPLCSCAADNLASKRAIEHAGFISEQRMVTMHFAEGAEDDRTPPRQP